jgi:hypothetical protein
MMADEGGPPIKSDIDVSALAPSSADCANKGGMSDQPMQITIRRYQPADAPQIAELYFESVRQLGAHASICSGE